VPVERLPSLLSNSVASAFMKRPDEWLADFDAMVRGIGRNVAVGTMCDGVASRLGAGKGFVEQVVELHGLLTLAGMQAELWKFIKDSPQVGCLGKILPALRGLEGVGLRDAIRSYAEEKNKKRVAAYAAASARKKAKT